MHEPDAPSSEQLALQNELLSLENRVLRSSASAARDGEIEELRQRTVALETQLKTDLGAAEARAKTAESDLRWLLDRLDRSPAGPLLRRYRGFRLLIDRWM